MRRRNIGLLVLSLVVLTGCPEDFGKEGTIDRAVHRDALELMQKKCTRAEYEAACGGDRKGTEKCRQDCGG